jgi:outer membrane protein OmpA-like peptidoglycan-associated protein
MAKGAGTLPLTGGKTSSDPAQIPCDHKWRDLKPVFDDMIGADEVRVSLIRYTYSKHRVSTLQFEFQGEDMVDTLRQWFYLEKLKPTENPDATKVPSVIYTARPPDEESASKTAGDLEMFRSDARLYIRFFRELVADAVPVWGELNKPKLQTMDSWALSWKSHETERWVVVPSADAKDNDSKDEEHPNWHPNADGAAGRGKGERPIRTEPIEFYLQVDDELRELLKRKMGETGVCEAPPLTIHFNLDRPRSLSDERGVLANPEELEQAAKELKFLLSMTRVKLKITVQGQTDSSGPRLHNKKLSERRAEWVIDRLRKNPLGLDLTNVKPSGSGEENAPQNQRLSPAHRIVVIRVTPDK